MIPKKIGENKMLSILLLNDNKIVSRLLQLSSKKSGFDIEESGVFVPKKEFYNLIFVDSDKYTPELVKEIKETLTYDKLVFIGTAQAKKPDEFAEVLEKPFLPTDFVALVEKSFVIENDKTDDIDNVEDEEIDLDSELENTFDLEEETKVEDLAQMVEEIDELDLESKELDEELNLDDEALFEDDDLGISEDLLEVDEEDKESEEIAQLPDIDDELEDLEKTSDEIELDKEPEGEVEVEPLAELEESLDEEVLDKNQDEKIEEFASIDKTEMKNFLEPSPEDEQTEEIEKEVTKEVDEELDESLEDKTEEETKKEEVLEIPENEQISKLIEDKLKEIITPDLIKEALKDMKITINFGDM